MSHEPGTPVNASGDAGGAGGGGVRALRLRQAWLPRLLGSPHTKFRGSEIKRRRIKNHSAPRKTNIIAKSNAICPDSGEAQPRRTVGGCALYVSDKPGCHDFSVLPIPLYISLSLSDTHAHTNTYTNTNTNTHTHTHTRAYTHTLYTSPTSPAATASRLPP